LLLVLVLVVASHAAVAEGVLCHLELELFAGSKTAHGKRIFQTEH